MACYYVVISSTHLRDGQLRSIKGVFRGPIGANGTRSEAEAGPSLYCTLCNKQYKRQQQYDNHTSSYDHHHRQRLKELKQREFYRLLGSRRQRRGRKQSQQRERGSAHSVAGLGPMFRNTTVALDTSVDDPKVLTSHTKDPETSKVGSSAQLSSCPVMQDTSSVDIQPSLRDKPAESLYCLTHNDQTTTAPPGTSTHMSANPHLWSETRVRPVCFSLPKRCSTLCHQSAAVFLQTTKERMTQMPDDVDHIDSSNDQADFSSGAFDALKPTQENPKAQTVCPKNNFLPRPKEPFCRVLNRDSTTVLLWPSEMVSYTHTAPSISYSVNPLLHNFRAGNMTTEVPVDKRTELERSEPSVIKQDEQQQRQADALGGGAPNRHERDRGDGGGQPASAVKVVSHYNSSNCDESALNHPSNSESESYLVHTRKKRRRKKTKRGRGRMRRKKKGMKKLRARSYSQEEGPGILSNRENTKELGKDQAASNDHKRAELFSHLPVSHFNRCDQLCAQVNNQASHHPSQQSVSEWGQHFRKLPSRGAACSTAISLVPGSDIEIPRCPAITPCPAQSSTDVGEAHAERQRGENGVMQENVAKDQKLVGKRTFDEAFNRETICCHNLNAPAEKSTAECTSPPCDATTEQVTMTLTSSKVTNMAPKIERKKLKKAERCMDHSLKLMCISSDLSVQRNTPLSPGEMQEVTNTTTQMLTAIVKTNINAGSHFVSRRSLCVEEASVTTCSCCHRVRTHRATERSSTNCECDPFGECQNTAYEKNIHNYMQAVKNAKNQDEKTHCMTTVSKASSDLESAETLGCQFDCTNHFTNCNCAEKDTNDGVVNVVLISTHPEQTRKEDERKQVQEMRKEDKREEDKREEGKVQKKRKMVSDRMKGKWACLPLLPPYLLHHTFLQQYFVPLSQPMMSYAPFTSHYSPHLPLSPPVLPVALYSSAHIPFLDGPYPVSPFPSIQSGDPSLYGPPPPVFVPTQLIFSKSAAFSIS